MWRLDSWASEKNQEEQEKEEEEGKEKEEEEREEGNDFCLGNWQLVQTNNSTLSLRLTKDLPLGLIIICSSYIHVLIALTT